MGPLMLRALNGDYRRGGRKILFRPVRIRGNISIFRVYVVEGLGHFFSWPLTFLGV